MLRDFENASPLISCLIIRGPVRLESVRISCKTVVETLMTSYRPNGYQTTLLTKGLLLPFKFETSWCSLRLQNHL